jgi:hypothetical protein
MILLLLLQAAQVPPPPPGERQPAATVVAEPVALAMAGWDADGDARTTRAEMQAGAAKSFAALAGAAGDLGYLAFADWAERWLGNRSALPSPFELDADADNRITRAEFETGLGRVFDRLDTNKDGALTRAELLTVQSGLRPLEPGRRRRR